MKITEEPPKKCIKSTHLIGDCLICCLWVTSVPQVGIEGYKTAQCPVGLLMLEYATTVT